MKIAIIGGGIVGSTAAFYLSQRPDYQVSLYDWGEGQATKAAAGIICPWFSKRRNQAWYRLANQGAHFYPQLMADLLQAGQKSLAYQSKKAWLLKNRAHLIPELIELAQSRREQAPLIGEIRRLTPDQQKEVLAGWRYNQDLIEISSGAAVVDGQGLCRDLQAASQTKGLKIYQEQISLARDNQGKIQLANHPDYDRIILASGAWLGQLLQPLGYQADVRGQKGQLAVYQLHQEISNWPLIMPEGEGDIIPHQQEQIYVGASHENDQAFDLKPDPQALNEIINTANQLLADLDRASYQQIKVGTRAYTSDFAPFYGPLNLQSHVLVASGLGSSGLTTGPLIGHQLSQMVQGEPLMLDPNDYPVARYVKHT
ncbi:oxidoreductase [Aerococcus urinaehominis]|uniref:Oxidoreductase n=1 Tax=Aerococcus urinaehominis TaxID=128944 RepID=A0A109RGT5_9LACT|nr:FAD-binding oxidoreductase [Aerococcus urinaehominis]AMB99216.1 oxidoreductase [Aerococcus urinaehominis]SDM32096.1 Glycine/D-amino acid oxidase [Aerococcus urinaehominis]